MPFVHEWQRDFNLTYDMPIADGNLTFRAAHHYVDERESTDDNLGFVGTDYTETDVTIAYGPNAGNWRVTLFGKNLSNEVESGFITNARNPGWIIQQSRLPRRYGVEFVYEF